ncbi:MAG: fused MFS/spermidine synthase [Acidobacteriota bacterium]
MTNDRRFPLVLACFVLSGMAGLIYQTAWTRLFAVAFGTSELAVATVLAAYMAGLTAGAALVERRLHLIRRPLRLYALLELGIALAALLVPPAVRLSSQLQVAVLGGLEVPPDAGSLASAMFYLVAAFVILLVPTALMGATLPLLARHAIRRDAEVGSRIGLLYAANTVGAALGVVLAAFVLLPRMGLGATQLVAVAVNVLVFGLALLLTRPGEASALTEAKGSRETAPVAADRPPNTEAAPAKILVARWILPLMLISGAVSFSWEVLWTRLLSHLLGGSIYAFGTMLATFLIGIGLGSAVAARWATDARRAGVGWVVAQLGMAATSLTAFLGVERLTALSRLQAPRTGLSMADPSMAGLAMESLSHGSLLLAVTVAAVTLLPSALFLGATFPFAVRLLAGDAAHAGQASARVYAWNTLGAIIGAIATGFVVLPGLRLAGTATAAIALSLALALAASLLLHPKRLITATAAAIGLALLVAWPPSTPWKVLRTTPLSGIQWPGEVAFYGVGRSATVMLLDQGDELRVTTNGLPESAIQTVGARTGRYAIAHWLGLLPIVSRPESSSYLVIGLGAGITLEAIPPTAREIHLVELEPEVLQANRLVVDRRRHDPFSDPRLQVHLNDARSALMLSDRQFDAIVSQPSHPWTAGASHLFTREFFALVSDRLNPEGVFVQWVGMRFVDPPLVRSLMATLLDVFPHVELYRPPPGGGLLFLAGKQPFDIARSAERALQRGGERWRDLGVTMPEDLFLARALDIEGARKIAEGAPLITDSRNLLQTDSPRLLRRPPDNRALNAMLSEHDPLPRLASDDSAVDRSPVVTVRRLIYFQFLTRAQRVAETISEPAARQTALALIQLADRQKAQGLAALRDVAISTPGPSEALFGWMLAKQPTLHTQPLPPELEQRIASIPLAAAVLEGWRLVRVQNPRAVRRLEPVLATAEPRHPLFEAATRLRIFWRQGSQDPDLASEALELLHPLLVVRIRLMPGLVQRATLARIAGQNEIAYASLSELSRLKRPRPSPALARRGLRILESLPDTALDAARRDRLAADLEKLARPQVF